MSARPKSAQSETPIAKVSQATPRVSKARVIAKPDPDSASPKQNARSSVDKSPRPVASKKPTVARSPNLSTPPDKRTPRVSKPLDVQSGLNQAQDLKETKEKLVLAEKERENALEELKQSRRLAEEANEKFREALVAQKRAEEDSEIEKFRAIEIEQANIEAAQKKDEEWQKELEIVRNQHAVDVAALMSATQELQKVRLELTMTCDAKNQALIHAEEATKIAEAHAEKVEAVSIELAHVKSLLEAQLNMEVNQNNKVVSELELEIESLRQELEKAKNLEVALAEKEAALEQINVDLVAARMAESYARNLFDELHEKVDESASQAEHAKKLERSASESLESVMKQLERSNDLLHAADSEIAALKEQVGLFEISTRRHKTDLDELEHNVDLAKREYSEMAKKVESLTSELETLKEEKSQSLNNEKLAAESIQTLLEEKNKLINELEASRDEEEKSKKALESLASALHEVSAEARDAKEKLLSVQVEHENSESQIEDLKLVLKATNEKYEALLDDAKVEIEALTNSIEHSKHEYASLKAEWEQKELHSVNSLKKSGEENSSLEKEVSRLLNLLKVTESEASVTREQESRWKNICNEAENEVVYLKQVLGEAIAESMRLKESLMDKENEVQNILHENEELRKSEVDSHKKVEELSKLLEEALAKSQHGKENGELTDSEKEYDVLPKVVEFSEQNGTGDLMLMLEPEVDVPKSETIEKASEVKSSNGKLNDHDDERGDYDSAEVDLKTWESCKIEEKDLSPEREAVEESLEDDEDSKAEAVENYEQVNGLSSNDSVDNGGSSPQKQQQHSQKKKKPLLHKFSNLLKKNRSPKS